MSPRTVAPGNWAFDLKSRQLIYVVDRGDYFKPGKDGQKWVRFRVNLLYEAAEGAGASGKELVGVFDSTNFKKLIDHLATKNVTIASKLTGYELPVEAICGGIALCATCQVYIESKHPLSEPTDDEWAMLDQAMHVRDNSRLGCQIRIEEDLDGIIVRLAPEQV